MVSLIDGIIAVEVMVIIGLMVMVDIIILRLESPPPNSCRAVKAPSPGHITAAEYEPHLRRSTLNPKFLNKVPQP